MRHALSPTTGRSLAVAAVLALVGLAPAARAQDGEIYKYVKPDGTVVFTQSLAEVPTEKRKEYQKAQQARAEERERLERTLGKDEVQRREAEAARQRADREAQNAADREARLRAIEERLADGARQREAEDKLKQTWQQRMKAAKQRRAQLWVEYQKAKAEWEALAMRAPGTLFPGEAEARDAALERMKKLEPQLEEANADVVEKIPDEARRAGIPPGWLR
jgi:hypothetical protein